MGGGDLISREAVMKWLNNELATLKPYNTIFASIQHTRDYVVCTNAVANAPHIDAVPVIRCKDCIHRGSSDCPMYVEDEGWCEHCGNEFHAVDRTEDDGFCHLGTITNAED